VSEGKRSWNELLVWTFHGERFNEDGIELAALENLVALRLVLVELAKQVWKTRHDRSRLPNGAEEALELRVFKTEPGSCAVRIFFEPSEDAGQGSLFDDGRVPLPATLSDALPEAALKLLRAVEAIQQGDDPPGEFPVGLLPDLEAALTKGMRSDEFVAVKLPAKLPEKVAVAITLEPSLRSLPQPLSAPYAGAYRPAAREEHPHERVRREWDEDVRRSTQEITAQASAGISTQFAAAIAKKTHVRRTISGEVTMANVVGNDAILMTEEGQVRVTFLAAHEKIVTHALHEHGALLLRIRGAGEVDIRSGNLKSLVAEDLEILDRPNPNAPSEALFRKQAISNPEALVATLRSPHVEPSILTYAAEVAGQLLAGDEVVEALVALLDHRAPVVREGAALGLASHARHPRARTRLGEVADHDSSAAVRATAAAALEVDDA
jgi:hypothetical protein